MQQRFRESVEEEPGTRYREVACAQAIVAEAPGVVAAPAKLLWTARVRREVALRILGALTLPVLAGSLLHFVALNGYGIPTFEEQSGLAPFLDKVLLPLYFLGLAGVGYQAVTGRRVGKSALAGVLGALVAAPLTFLVFLGLALTGFWELFLRLNQGVGSFYPAHLQALLPATGFLFAAWCTALGTRPRAAVLGGARFALIAFCLYQLRDCLASPELWSQWPRLLLTALVAFVLPGGLLGALSAWLGQLVVRALRAK